MNSVFTCKMNKWKFKKNVKNTKTKNIKTKEY